MECIRSPVNDQIGKIPVSTTEQLHDVYEGKKVLIVGGTRGVGLGTALAVAQAGADVTVVGRSLSSGNRAVEQLQQVAAADNHNTIFFVPGDLGTVASSRQLVHDLSEHVQQKHPTESQGFDYLVVSAAVFPDWTQPQQQEDGIDKCFAIAVVGRYILYKNMARFMKVSTTNNSNNNHEIRVLNVMASGEMPHYFLKRDLASGERNAKGLLEATMTMATGNELMQILVDEDPQLALGTTRVSTSPGVLKTDLHRGQGWCIDCIEAVTVAIMGISVQDCGICQASILASPLLPEKQLSYVSSDMRGRLMHKKLKALAETDLPWLEEFLQHLVDD